MKLNTLPWKRFGPSCPPAGAISQNIDPVYRLVHNDPIEYIDFTPQGVLRPNCSKYQSCIGMATSCGDLNFVKNVIKKLSYFRTCKIDVGKINSSDGKTLVDHKKGHVSWWITINSPQKKFKVMP